jgi:hypothetical protein
MKMNEAKRLGETIGAVLIGVTALGVAAWSAKDGGNQCPARALTGDRPA